MGWNCELHANFEIRGIVADCVLISGVDLLPVLAVTVGCASDLGERVACANNIVSGAGACVGARVCVVVVRSCRCRDGRCGGRGDVLGWNAKLRADAHAVGIDGWVRLRDDRPLRLAAEEALRDAAERVA